MKLFIITFRKSLDFSFFGNTTWSSWSIRAFTRVFPSQVSLKYFQKMFLYYWILPSCDIVLLILKATNLRLVLNVAWAGKKGTIIASTQPVFWQPAGLSISLKTVDIIHWGIWVFAMWCRETPIYFQYANKGLWEGHYVSPLEGPYWQCFCKDTDIIV